jgi:hypothetical protein
MAASTGTGAHRRRQRLAEVALVLGAMLLPVAGLELYLRLRGGDTRSFTQPDALLGWSYIPGARYVHEAAEDCPGWGASGVMNSFGLRDREFPEEKDSGVVRILALGDSFTEAFQFDLERTWTKLVEQGLAADGGGRRFEVINAGRSGMGTTLEWLYFAERGRRLGADVVLLLFVPNDFQENSARLALATAYGPYLVPSAEGGFALDTSFLADRDYVLRKRMTSLKRASYVVSAGLDRYKAWRAAQAAQRFAASRGKVAGKVDVAAREGLGPSWTEEDFLWVEEPAADWLEAARITQEALRRLGRDVRESGARLVVFGGTSRIQVHPAAMEETLAAHPTWDLDRPARYIREVAEEGGFAFHDLVPAFREAAAATDAYLHGCERNGGEGHWSALGHRLAADEMTGYLLRAGVLDGAESPGAE